MNSFRSNYRKEALILYREVLRTCKVFYWSDERGIPWCRVLREKAREEFELNRNEKDPLIIARKLVMGWEAIEETKKRFNTVEDVIKKRIENTRIRT